MRVYTQSFRVSFTYPVYFARDVLDPDRPELKEAIVRGGVGRQRCFVVVESRIVELYPALQARIARYFDQHREALELVDRPLVLGGGEACKNSAEAPFRLQRAFNAAGLDRHAHVIVIGGGSFQDLVGFAASTTHRGLRVVRVPTTVLSQNDSGVGVKNGINALGKKNLVGTFAPPHAVVVDFDFLETLERRDRVAGMAEAVKVALIRDAQYFEWLEAHATRLERFDAEAVAELVERCAVLHLEHIAGGGDPFETGTSRPLDFGHWSAHKLESLSDYELRHGEAVAIGIALDTLYSVERDLLPASDGERVLGLLERLGFTLWSAHLDDRSEGDDRAVLAGLEEFREHLGGVLTVTLLEAIGRAQEVHSIDPARVERCIERLRLRHFSGIDRARASTPSERTRDGARAEP